MPGLLKGCSDYAIRLCEWRYDDTAAKRVSAAALTSVTDKLPADSLLQELE